MNGYSLYLKFYLAGAISWVKDNSFMEWRSDMMRFLEDLHFEGVNPLGKYADPQEEKLKVEALVTGGNDEMARDYIQQRIIDADLTLLEGCDAVIAFCPCYSAGTFAELGVAYSLGKPIYIVTDMARDKMGAWVLGLSTRLFGSFDELKAYLKLMDGNKRWM